MAEEIKRKRTPPRNGKPAAGGTRKATAAKPAAKPVPPAAPPVIEVPPAPKPAVRTLKKLPPKDIEEPSLISRLMDLPGSMAGSAINFVVKKTELPLRVGKAMLLKQDQADVLEKAGKTFRELREVAGVTLDELAQEINLKDKSLLEAVENGTATLSFELIVSSASANSSISTAATMPCASCRMRASTRYWSSPNRRLKWHCILLPTKNRWKTR